MGTETAAITIDNGSGSATTRGYPELGTLVEVRSSADVYKCTAVVTTYTSTTSIEITPLYVASDGVTAGANNDIYYCMGRAEKEGDISPTAWSDDLEVVWGSCQIQKTPLEITGTVLKLTKLRGYSSELARLRTEKYNEHNIGLNRSFLFGVRYPSITTAPSTAITGSGYEAANARIIRTTWGIVTLLRRHGTTNTNKFSRSYAAYTWDDFVDDMELSYKYNNLQGTKFAFCGAGVLGFFSKVNGGIMGNSSFSFDMSPGMVPTKFGFQVKTIMHPFGTLHLVYDPAMRGQYNDTMVIADPEDLRRIVFREPMLQTAIQANDADLVKDQYFSDEGLGVALTKKHSLYEFA